MGIMMESMSDLRRKKRSKIIDLIRKRKKCSRSDITAVLNIDKKTVSLVVDDFLDQKLVLPIGFRESKAGRRQELLAVNGSHSNYIGIDLGSTHIIGVRTDLNCLVLDRVFFELRPELPVSLILEQMKSIIKTLIDSDKGTGEIKSVGISIPGFVNPVEGIALMAENIPGWHEVRIREILEKEIHKPVYVEDCSRTMGLAELWLGKGEDVENFIVLDLGYGIGMALFLNGEMYTGSGYKSGEIGHTLVDENGPVCTCGKKGCLELYASGRGIARIASENVLSEHPKILEELIHGDVKSLNAQDVALAASMNDEYSLGIITSAGRYIGTALSSVVNILNPEKIIIGGGLTGMGKPLFNGITETLELHTMKEIMADLKLEQSDLGVDASARGSALVAMEHVFSLLDSE